MLSGQLGERIKNRCSFCGQEEKDSGKLLGGISLAPLVGQISQIRFRPSICRSCVCFCEQVFKDMDAESSAQKLAENIVQFRSRF